MAERRMPERNKHTTEQTKKVRRQVVSGDAKKRKKTYTEQFRDAFFGAQVDDVKSYLVFDVLMPGIKDTILNSIQLMFYGKVKRGSSSGYASMYSRDSSSSRSKKYEYDEITFDTRKEAMEVLDEMLDIIECDGDVTVADMYQLVGWKEDYTDHKYGWRNLRSADVISTKDGYVIDLPRAKEL